MYIPKKKKKNSKLNSIFWKLFSHSFKNKNKNPPTKTSPYLSFLFIEINIFHVFEIH